MWKAVGRKKQNKGVDMGHHIASVNPEAKKDIEFNKAIKVQVLEEICTSVKIYGEETHVDCFNTNSKKFDMGEASKLMSNSDSKFNKIRWLKKSQVGVLNAEVSESHGSHGKIIIIEEGEIYELDAAG